MEGWVNVQYLNFTINPFDLPTISTTPPGFPTATPTATPQVTNPINIVGVVNTGALNVRSGPSPSFSIVDVMYFGDVMDLIGRNADGSWVYGSTPDGILGWVNSRYLTTSSPVANLPVVDSSTPGVPINPATPVATAVPTAIPGSASVTAGYLNVRSGAGIGYTRVASLSYGDVVAMTGRNLDSSWVMVRLFGGQEGWVNPKYLATTVDVGSLPVMAQSGTGFVVAGNLNIRSGAGPGFSVVTVAPYGSSLALLGRTSDNSWLYLRAGNGQEGWSNASYIATSLDVNLLPVLAGPVPGQPIQPPVGAPEQAPINPGNSASLRSCPNLSCPASGTVYSGLAVTATGRTADNSWIYVVLSDGQQGWIQAQYVVLGVPVNNLPIVSTSPTG